MEPPGTVVGTESGVGPREGALSLASPSGLAIGRKER
jgi:hypothetical protein